MTTISINTQQIYGHIQSTFSSAFVLPVENKQINKYTIRSTSVAEAVNLALDVLAQRRVSIEDRAHLENFLIANNGLITYLYQAPEKISNYFQNPTLKLGISYDFDNTDEQSEIFLEVQTHLSPKEANEALSKLNRDWIFNTNNQDLQLLNITLSFV